MFLNPPKKFPMWILIVLMALRNLKEQVKKHSVTKNCSDLFTIWINCSSNLKNFAKSWRSASNFKSFSGSLEQFFLTVGQNNFGKQNTNSWPEFHLKLHKWNSSTECHSFLVSTSARVISHLQTAIAASWDFLHNGARFNLNLHYNFCIRGCSQTTFTKRGG